MSEDERACLMAIAINSAQLEEIVARAQLIAMGNNSLIDRLLDIWGGQQKAQSVKDEAIPTDKECCANCSRRCCVDTFVTLDGKYHNRVMCDIDNSWRKLDGWCPQYPVLNQNKP